MHLRIPKITLFSTYLMPLHYILWFTNTYGLLGILTGMSLLTLQIICLSSGKFAKIILLPASRTLGVISVLLRESSNLQFSSIISGP